MKTIIILISLTLIMVSCDKKVAVYENNESRAIIAFDSVSKNIGEINLEKQAEVLFYAKNISEVPLIIDTVKSSCSCVVSEFPKMPILKGDSSTIRIIYKAPSNYIGLIEKAIVIHSNAKPAFSVLKIKGKVVK